LIFYNTCTRMRILVIKKEIIALSIINRKETCWLVVIEKNIYSRVSIILNVLKPQIINCYLVNFICTLF
jgi:hypothetical protein